MDGVVDDKLTPDQGQKPELPDQLKGKSPEEMFQILQQEHERVLETEKLKARAEAVTHIKEAISSSPPSPPKETPDFSPQFIPPAPHYGQQQQEEPDIFSDQEGFMDRQFQKRMGPIVQTTFDSLKETNKHAFAARMANDGIYQKYKDEVDSFVAGLHPQVQINPRAYEVAYNFVRSQHVDEIAKSQADEQTSQKLQAAADALRESGIPEDRIAQILGGDVHPAQQPQAAPSSLFQPNTIGVKVPPHTERASATPPKPKAGLTAEQKEMAKRFGMTDTEYSAYAEANTDVLSQMGRGR